MKTKTMKLFKVTALFSGIRCWLMESRLVQLSQSPLCMKMRKSEALCPVFVRQIWRPSELARMVMIGERGGQ